MKIMKISIKVLATIIFNWKLFKILLTFQNKYYYGIKYTYMK